LLLNVREWRRWAGDRDIWRRTTEEAIEEDYESQIINKVNLNMSSTQPL
jgi:hypothetical protein